MTTITLLGAGGKMGLRITDNLRKTDYDVRYVEVSERGKAGLAERGIKAVTAEEALAESNVVILALPDNLIGRVTSGLNTHFKPGSMLIALDIAAPLAGHLPQRDDLVFFVTHPCHPSVFGGETAIDEAVARGVPEAAARDFVLGHLKVE